MTRRRPLISRIFLAMLVAFAITLQGVPSIQADRAEADMPVAWTETTAATTTPCHAAQDVAQHVPAKPGPAKSNSDSFACCAVFACGMLVQALPPGAIAARAVFANRFSHPDAARSVALAEPDPAWRPPAHSL